MDVERARDFVRGNSNTVLATFRRDGRPQLSPVNTAIDDGGFAVISSRETAVKVKNVRRDPRVSLCVLNDRFYGEWAQLDGTAEIVPLPDAMEGLVDYYRRLSGEHPDWDDYRAAMVREQRVVIRVTIERAGPDVSG
ncbi:MAG TPA: PPOX class F420-dependent oxidoreductase [Acidimicrobiia bacterium]